MSNEQWSEWIEWNGGGCPLPEGTVCDVRHRDGDYGTRVHAGLNSCEDDSTGSALAEDWGHTGYGGDIIAYRYRLDDNTMTEEEQEIPAEDWKGCVDADGDMVNHPPHYQLRNGYEVYDLRQDLARKAQAANVPHDQYSDWDRALEYLLRMWDKNGVEDAKKGAWYINKLIGKLEAPEVRAKEIDQ